MNPEQDRQPFTEDTTEMSLAEHSLSGTHVLCDKVLMLWERHLSQRIMGADCFAKEFTGTSPGENALSYGGRLQDSTASNYLRYVKKCLTTIDRKVGGLETATPDELHLHIESYLQALEARNGSTARAVRSALLGQFVPWCIEAQLLPLDCARFEKLLPLPFEKFCAPLVNLFLIDRRGGQSSTPVPSGSDSEIFRKLYRWIATEYLGFSLAQLRGDSRSLFAREPDSIDALKLQMAAGHQNRGGISVTQMFVRDDSLIGRFIAEVIPRDLKGDVRSIIHEYREWLINHRIELGIMSVPVVVANESQETNTHEPVISSLSEPAVKGVDSERAQVKRPHLKERRLELSETFRDSLSLRDELIDVLLRDEGVSIHALIALERRNIEKVASHQYQVTIKAGELELSGSAGKLCGRYLARRKTALEELNISSKDRASPVFMSADGGGLIVWEGEVRASKPTPAVNAVRLGLELIEQLIKNEEHRFADLRVLSMDDLQTFDLISEDTRALREKYLRLLQTSPLQFFSIAREGPRLAFPAVDGDRLTADGD